MRSLLILVAALASACTQEHDASNSLPPTGEIAVTETAAAGGFLIAPEFPWAESAVLEPPAAAAGANTDTDTDTDAPADAGADAGTLEAVSGLEHGAFGLFPTHEFRIPAIGCTDCGAPAAALWYFRDELVAVPRDADTRRDLPPLVWLGAPEVVDGATVARDGSALLEDGIEMPLRIAPRLSTNTAYADRSTLRFFAGRTVRARGATRIEGGRAVFVARTLWPSDARIDVPRLELSPLQRNERLGAVIEGEWGGRNDSRFPARLLFERRGTARDWAGKTALAFVLSGAQGDDDGSRAGHLAIATGTFGLNGEWRDWLVDDFYPLDAPNPKGIVSAPVPIDNYLFDFNAGQLYYRPAYMLVAVLRKPAVAAAVQSALQRTMLRYYCRALDFDLARNNSTALSVDPLRGLGWRIPKTGPTSLFAALLAGPVAAIAERSITTGAAVYAAFAQEQTRLLPRAAFEAVGEDLLALLAANGRHSADASEFERRLAEDVEAVLLVRLPQVPSSRRLGTYPERSLLVYAARLLTDPGPYERPAAVAAEPFPAELAASCGAFLEAYAGESSP